MTIVSYAQAVGERLRNVRFQKALSLHDVEVTSRDEFKASVLGAYERGERVISVPRLQRLARFYGVSVDQLLPRETGSRLSPPASTRGALALVAAEQPPPRPTSGWDERVTIDLGSLESLRRPEGDLLIR